MLHCGAGVIDADYSGEAQPLVYFKSLRILLVISLMGVGGLSMSKPKHDYLQDPHLQNSRIHRQGVRNRKLDGRDRN